MKLNCEYPESVLAADNYSYREREWRAPKVKEDEEIIFDEPGRVLRRHNSRPTEGGICCRSHYFRITKLKYGTYMLLVRHGGGEESVRLNYDRRVIDGLAQMDSDARYWLCWIILDAHYRGAKEAREQEEAKWRKAAAQKRIKTRKVKAGVKVWIESESTP